MSGNGDFDGPEPFVREPLAVVGMAFKFPQEASSAGNFWKMLLSKQCAMTEWPADRLNIDAFYHPDASRPDTVGSFPSTSQIRVQYH